jgi:hypothetical protein
MTITLTDEINALRKEILRGVIDIQQRRFTSYSSDSELEAFSDEIIEQAQAGDRSNSFSR